VLLIPNTVDTRAITHPNSQKHLHNISPNMDYEEVWRKVTNKV